MDIETKQPLLERHDCESDLYEEFLARSRVKRSRQLWLSLASNIVLAILVLVLAIVPLVRRKDTGLQDVFSPAHEAIEYETRVFRSGLHGDMTEYQGSSEAVLQRWQALYNDIGMTQIDGVTAHKIPNATTPTSYDHSQYVVQLDVFHTLHCLNLLRKRLYPDIYPPSDDEDSIYHLEHCVESIRQSLQCSSDVSTIYWEWSEKEQKTMGNLKTTHTCRKFEKIQEWAREHEMTQDTDFLQHVPGSPLRSE